MNETAIYPLLRILASHASANGLDVHVDPFVEEILNENVSSRLRIDFATYYKNQKRSHAHCTTDVAVANDYSLTKEICLELRKYLSIEDRYLIIVTLLEWAGRYNSGEGLSEFVELVAFCLNLDPTELKFIRRFVAQNDYGHIDPSRLVTLSGAPDISNALRPCVQNVGFITARVLGLDGCIRLLYLPDIQSYLIKYYGEAKLYIDSRDLIPEKVYIFQVGSTIKGYGVS